MAKSFRGGLIGYLSGRTGWREIVEIARLTEKIEIQLFSSLITMSFSVTSGKARAKFIAAR
jgi:hypothetical protein